MSPLDWLLDEEAPPVAWQTRRLFLGESVRSARMRALRRQAHAYAPTARLLERLGRTHAVHPYAKYRGAYWTLIFLAELGADGKDRRVRDLGRSVLETRLPDGGFSPHMAGFHLPLVCLTANVLRALTTLGFAADERVHRGWNHLAGRLIEHDGVPCWIIENHSLLTRCSMTLPHTLRALNAAPEGVFPRKVARARKLVVKRLLENGVHRYVRADARRFYRELVPDRPKGKTFKELKADYVARHPESTAERLPKPGWLSFGFPTSYNTDLLEGLHALAEAGVPPNPALDEALDHVESRRRKDGRWALERSLNGKMIVNVERKGQASRWITRRALLVLQHFRGLQLVS